MRTIRTNGNGYAAKSAFTAFQPPIPRRLISIAHSYCVALNRRLAHEMAISGQGKWEVTAVSPAFFYGDLRPIQIEPLDGEACNTEAVDAYFTRHIHFMLYSRRLRELLQRKWDLVHCWEEPYVLSGGQVAMWTPQQTPLAFWTAQNISKRYPLPFAQIEKYSMDRCAAWMAAGQSVVEVMLQRGYGQKPHSVMPLGVEIDQFRPNPAQRKEMLQRLEWQDTPGVPIVGFLGRFVPEKGLTILMQALEGIRSPWRALFVGTGAMKAHLEKWSQPFGNRVRIAGSVKHEEVMQYLSVMDILCAPSQTTVRWREQFGRMLIEAFACGVPVVASDSGEIPYVVGDAGIIVPENDHKGWTQAIEELLGDPGRRDELSKRGLERVHRLYAWRVVAEKYLDFFNQISDAPR